MDHYEIWCDLKDGRKDLEFANAVQEYLGSLRERGLIEGFRLARRKLGFGPPELGEFRITITVRSLAQLDEAFGVVARRAGAVEERHARVYHLVAGARFGLYRDFPDPQRAEAAGPPERGGPS